MLRTLGKHFITIDAFLYAASHGNLRVVQDFLDKNPASIDKTKFNLLDEDYDLDNDWSVGKTALMLAAEGGHLHVIQELLRRGAKVNLIDSYGKTALIAAVIGGHLPVIRELISRGAIVDQLIPNQKDSCKRTALMFGIAYHVPFSVIELLLEYTTPDLRDDAGNTALIYAAYRNRLDVIKLLLEKDADVYIKNKMHKTAYYYASQKNHAEIAQLLLDYMNQSENYKVDALLAPPTCFERLQTTAFIDEIPDEFECPLTRIIMSEPVDLIISGTVFTFERSAITQWLSINKTNPMTNLVIDGEVILKKNTVLLAKIENFVKKEKTANAKKEMLAARNRIFTRERLGQSNTQESKEMPAAPTLSRSPSLSRTKSAD
jgi:hypothetical protein